MTFWKRLSIYGMALATVLLAACGSSPVYEQESFNPGTPYQYPVAAESAAVCEAARLALLSQGYAAVVVAVDQLKGSKDFQPAEDVHAVIEFNVTCASTRTGTMLYANALEKRYKLKKNSTSAGLSVPTLGSISVPLGGSTDSMVMVSSQTISDPDFYKRFYGLIDKQLGIEPQKK
jgi:hypothetical protein